MTKTKTTFLVSTLTVAALLVTLAGCASKTNTENSSIRPANEASEEGSAEETTATATPIITPTPTSTACTLTKPSFGSSQAFHQVLFKYFDAIDHKNYDTAFAMLADDALARYASQSGTTKQNFVDFFTKNVACIQVTEIGDVTDRTKCPMVSASLGIQCYQVELEYYPPASTANPVKVPTIYTIISDPHAEGDRVENAQIINIQD